LFFSRRYGILRLTCYLLVPFILSVSPRLSPGSFRPVPPLSSLYSLSYTPKIEDHHLPVRVRHRPWFQFSSDFETHPVFLPSQWGAHQRWELLNVRVNLLFPCRTPPPSFHFFFDGKFFPVRSVSLWLPLPVALIVHRSFICLDTPPPHLKAFLFPRRVV